MDSKLDLRKKSLYGMVHVQALPGTPKNRFVIADIVKKAVEEAMLYEQYGFTGIIIENMHDTPYLNREVGPEISCAMAVIASEIRKRTSLPLGIQILAGANEAAVAAAHVSGANFVRAEGFVFSHVADEGWMDGCAGHLLRYRRQIGADEVGIVVDVKKKHSSHAITQDVDLASTIKAAEFFDADGMIITGGETGSSASLDDVKAARGATSKPIWIGSGITSENIESYMGHADGFIVGSSLKLDGHWANDLDPKALENLAAIFKRCR